MRFDIRFKIINPKLSTEKIRVNLHIDMEAQKSYRPSNPSYPILKRAVYYVARDLSSQLSTITQTTDYSKLEKCYSIWICAEDVPKKLQNTLTEYSFSKKDIIGVADEPEEDYDLLTVIIIRLGKETEEKGIFDYLKGLFTGDIKRIQRYSHIEWSEPFQEEASKMTGFGDMIYERGIQQGMQQGIQQGRHEGMILGGSHEWKNSRRSFEDVELASGRNKKSSGTADDCEQVVKVNYRYKINWGTGNINQANHKRGYAHYTCIAPFALVFMHCEYLPEINFLILMRLPGISPHL